MSLRDLNWRKGFFRLWILASLIWIIIFGILNLKPAIQDFNQSVKAERELLSIPEPNDQDPRNTVPEKIELLRKTMKYYGIVEIAQLKESRREALIFCLIETFSPPLILLILGKSFIWVFSGFSSSRRYGA